MHEMSLASGMLREVLRIAAESRARRVLEIEVHCGVFQQVVPEAMELAFTAVSAGTLAEGATLRVVVEELVGRCRACGRQYPATVEDWRCPGCGQADVELIQGRDVTLRTVVCETEDEATS